MATPDERGPGLAGPHVQNLGEAGSLTRTTMSPASAIELESPPVTLGVLSGVMTTILWSIQGSCNIKSINSLAEPVPGEGFEPPTFGLQNRCTAAVLTRQPYPISWVVAVLCKAHKPGIGTRLAPFPRRAVARPTPPTGGSSMPGSAPGCGSTRLRIFCGGRGAAAVVDRADRRAVH
jgi:hypothetical protein